METISFENYLILEELKWMVGFTNSNVPFFHSEDNGIE